MRTGNDRGIGCMSKKMLSIWRGQLISVFIAGTGIFATLLSSSTPNALFPQFMNTINYVLLSGYFLQRIIARRMAPETPDPFTGASVSKALTAGTNEGDSQLDNEQGSGAASSAQPQSTKQQQQQQRTEFHFGWYLLAALLDVEGNYLFIRAYDYTSITSIMLLDCFTIPSAMLLSYLFMGAKYKRVHVVGIVVCIAGLVCCVTSDVLQGRNAAADLTSSNQFLGDMMCILGSVMYASCNVLQERLVKQGSREHYMGNVGVSGMCIAGIQFLILDLPRMKTTHFSSSNVLSICGLVSCLFFMYTNTSKFLEDSDAVVFNLSLLTSDIYAVVFSYFRNGYLVPWLYFVAFFLVALGLFTYYSEPVVDPDVQIESERMRAGQLQRDMSRSLQHGEDAEDGDMSSREDDGWRKSTSYNPLAAHG